MDAGWGSGVRVDAASGLSVGSSFSRICRFVCLVGHYAHTDNETYDLYGYE